MDQLTAKTYQKLSGWLVGRGIQHSVLHGIDAKSGQLGRDLDLFVPDRVEAFRTAVHFSKILKHHGYRWVSLPHPLWGPRCVGVHPEGLRYVELHVLSRLRMGPVNVGHLFSLRAEPGILGFQYDSMLMLFKQVIMKHNRAILRGLPIWHDRQPQQFLTERVPTLGQEMQRIMPSGQQFVSALLGADNTTNLRLRRRGLLRLLGKATLRSPGNSIHMLLEYGSKRFERLLAPSGPYIFVDAHTDQLQEVAASLRNRVGGIFLDIRVIDRPMPWHARRRIQGRQGLVVVLSRQLTDSDRGANAKLHLGNERGCRSIQDIADEISLTALDSMVELNQCYMSLYEGT